MVYLSSIFFIGMILAGQQDAWLGVPLTVAFAIGFYKSMKRVPAA